MSVEEKLEALGYTLPSTPFPQANYIAYAVTGNLIFVSGQIAIQNGELLKGRLGADLSVEQGQEAARVCAINILSHIKTAVDGDWSKLKRCIKLSGFVTSTPEFTDQHLVMNGASDLVVGVLGNDFKHARFAVGVPCLPLGSAVEVDAIFELNT